MVEFVGFIWSLVAWTEEDFFLKDRPNDLK